MRMSGGALKGTIGAGGLGVLAVWVDRAEPVIGFWPLFMIVLTPFAIFLFVRRGEVSDRMATAAHAIAIGWYGALALSALGLMVWRGLKPVDGLFGAFIALGLIPGIAALRAMLRGAGRPRDPSSRDPG